MWSNMPVLFNAVIHQCEPIINTPSTNPTIALLNLFSFGVCAIFFFFGCRQTVSDLKQLTFIEHLTHAVPCLGLSVH